MITASFKEFRTKLKKFLNNVENNHETLMIKRESGNGIIMISLDEYNSIMETVHLLSSKANTDRLYESIQQMKSRETFKRELK